MGMLRNGGREFGGLWKQRKRSVLSFSTLETHHNHKWSIKQVTKSNFAETLEELKTLISSSHFVSVSLRQTGSYSAPWHKLLPFDTFNTAYFKAKFAAERFQLLQFAVCPFTLSSSKLVAHPYNFHLFPRDELKIGMPSYAFSCQSSYLTSMAQEGFDFNVCIYDGISYLSRAQESAAKDRLGSPKIFDDVIPPLSTSVADALFVERIKSRVKHWRNACRDLSTKTDEALLRSLRKLVLESKEYGSRPSMSIDVCSERQVQLTLQMLKEFFEDLVPLVIPTKGGGTQDVKVVLTSSKEDKSLFQRELKSLEDAQNKQVRGFRELIDLISTSQKPIISHNSLNDFAFIYSKFIGPLPPDVDDFTHSLRSIFPHILDINHLMKEIGPLKNINNLPAAISHLKRRFFLNMDVEIPQHGKGDGDTIHGRNVLTISHLFAKLCSLLKITPHSFQSNSIHLAPALGGFANTFLPFSANTNSTESNHGELRIWTGDTRKVGTENVIFLWGFRGGMSAVSLKNILSKSHQIFSEEFDVRLVGGSCATLVFWHPGLSAAFLEIMSCGGVGCEPLKEMTAEGLRAASYETYEQVCRLGLWEADLSDALDKAMENDVPFSETNAKALPSEINWSNDYVINLEDL
ncbi:Ribonuclease CAF1 [Dillenia turbinata]|uniref:Ribonuclease CAF1 n=1 Tax=Dillenia turbinata TaxID=194707 RepID=A0AAN8UK14_9MAGN